MENQNGFVMGKMQPLDRRAGEGWVFVDGKEIVTDSLTVANVFEKQHKDVMRDIRNLECSDEFNRRNFALIDYQDERNRTYKKCLIKRDGLAFLVMGYTGRKASEYKEKYIEEFNKMEQYLNNPLPTSPTELLRLSLRAIDEQGERLTGIETELSDLKTKQPLHPAQAAHVQKEVKRRVYTVLNEYFGGNKGGAKKLFSAINTDIHKAFGVPNRGMIPQIKYEEAIQFIKSWQPDSVVKYQLSLELNEKSEAG